LGCLLYQDGLIYEDFPESEIQKTELHFHSLMGTAPLIGNNGLF
jgi:hypothetical protein